MSSLDEEGICMLSLDGGGVRGLSSLYVLKLIVDRHNAKRKTLGQSLQKPVDIFDLTGGTGTRGRRRLDSILEDSKRRLRIRFDLAEAYAETGQPEKAIQLTEKAAKGHRFNGAPKHKIDRLEKLRKADSKLSAMENLILLDELGKCYNYAEEYEKAIASLEMGIDAAESKIAKDDPLLIGIKNNLAYAYEQKGKHKKSITLLEETLPIQRKVLGQVHKKAMSSENDLAELYLQNRNVYTA
ncbi:calcium-independent phospholipase [Fusarium bulbicola]|nr:calcium-independent phospholipase [Fusarium bulbicola]